MENISSTFSDVYFFTNLFPYNAQNLVPSVNHKRMRTLTYFFRYAREYDQISSFSTNTTQSQIDEASLEEMIMLIIRGTTVVQFAPDFLVYAKPVYHGKFPVDLLPFSHKSYHIYTGYDTFLGRSYNTTHFGLKMVVLPFLNIRPLVMGREMCILDQDLVVSMPENSKYFMTLCIMHQYFSATLRSYSPEVYFLDAGLRQFYGLLKMRDGEERITDMINHIIVRERTTEFGIRLVDYSGNMKESVRELHTKKGQHLQLVLRVFTYIRF